MSASCKPKQGGTRENHFWSNIIGYRFGHAHSGGSRLYSWGQELRGWLVAGMPDLRLGNLHDCHGDEVPSAQRSKRGQSDLLAGAQEIACTDECHGSPGINRTPRRLRVNAVSGDGTSDWPLLGRLGFKTLGCLKVGSCVVGLAYALISVAAILTRPGKPGIEL